MANMILAIKVLASYSISLLKYYCWYWKATKIIHSNSLNKEIIIDENFPDDNSCYCKCCIFGCGFNLAV